MEDTLVLIRQELALDSSATVPLGRSPAACLATERGLTVCAPVHDAFLIEAAADRIEEATAAMHAAMREASEAVLPGFPLKTDSKVIRHPERFADPRGEAMWATVTRLLAADDPPTTPAAGGTPPLPPAAPPPILLSLP